MLGDRVAVTELDDARLRAICDGLAALAELCVGEERDPWWRRGPDFGDEFRRRSVFSGVENPRSFGMSMEVTGSDDCPSVRGLVELNHTFSGPPHSVHGGVIAGLFDEILGSLASAIDPSAVVATATLKSRFRRPTPLGTPLVFEALCKRRSSQRLLATAICTANGSVTATAEALMIVRRARATRPAEERR
jgi:acyl-coenzyme A thioesterase PaaI-like protein